MLREGNTLFGERRYTEALECFAKATMVPEYSEEAMVGVARCYYRKEEFVPAYERFQELAEKGIKVEYAKEMMANIKIFEGEYSQAVRILEKLPNKNNNLLRLSLSYYLEFIHDNVEQSIYLSKQTLDQIEIKEIQEEFIWRIYLSYGLIYQAQKKYELAEKNYKKALNKAQTNEVIASVLNDYGSLYLELGKLDEAEKMLVEANEIVSGKKTICEGYNNKWLGFLYVKLEDYLTARRYLSNSVELLKEKRLFKELAKVNFMLLEVHKKILDLGGNREKNQAFLNSLDVYSEGMKYQNESEEVEDRDEKVVNLIVGGINGNGRNNS